MCITQQELEATVKKHIAESDSQRMQDITKSLINAQSTIIQHVTDSLNRTRVEMFDHLTDTVKSMTAEVKSVEEVMQSTAVRAVHKIVNGKFDRVQTELTGLREDLKKVQEKTIYGAVVKGLEEKPAVTIAKLGAVTAVVFSVFYQIYNINSFIHNAMQFIVDFVK